VLQRWLVINSPPRPCPPFQCSGPAALPTSQSCAARSSLTSLHMGKNIFQKKEIIKGVK